MEISGDGRTTVKASLDGAVAAEAIFIDISGLRWASKGSGGVVRAYLGSRHLFEEERL